MAMCEKCWSDAFIISQETYISQYDAYQELLRQRIDNPCSPRETAGQFWDETLGKDIRSIKRT